MILHVIIILRKEKKVLLHELQLWPFLLPSAFCTGAYDRFSVLYAQRKQPIIMTAECGIFKKSYRFRML